MQKIAQLEALVAKQTSPAPSAPEAPAASAPATPATPGTPAEPSRMEALLEKTLSRLTELEGKMSEKPKTTTAVVPAEQPKAVSTESAGTTKPSEKAKAVSEPPQEDGESESESDEDDDEWVTTPTGQKVTLIDI